MKRKARNAWMLARAISRVPNGPLFSPEGDGGGGGGEPPKMISEAEFQSRLDKVLGQRLADERKKYADYDSVKTQAQKATEYETELTKLREEKEMAGKSAEERERIAAKKASDVMERERQDLTTRITAAEARADAAVNARRDMIVNNGLGSALDGANVLAKARADAVEAFRNHSKVELDDDGRILTVTYGGVAYKTPAEAALAFLKDKDHFASGGRIVGGNSQAPNGLGGGAPPNAQNVSSENLISQGLSARARR